MENYVVAVLGDCDLFADEIADNSIAVLSKKYLDGKAYRTDCCDNVRLYRRFYDGLRNGKQYKFRKNEKTDYDEFFDNLIMSGKERILYLANSSFFDNDFNLAKKAAADSMVKFKHSEILVLDTKTIGLGKGVIALEASSQRFAASLGEAYISIKDRAERECLFIVVYDSEHVAYNGILSSSLVGGSLVGIKPIITVDEEGKLKLFKKCKGEKNAVASILSYAEKNNVDKTTFFVYGADNTRNELFAINMIQEKFHGCTIRVGKAGMSSGYLFAPNALFVGFCAQRIRKNDTSPKTRTYNDRIKTDE